MVHHSKKHGDAFVLAEMLGTLANANRLLILKELAAAERSVNDLAERLGLSQSSLSQHLAVLRQANLVKNRRKSQTRLYTVVSTQLESIGFSLHSFFNDGSNVVVNTPARPDSVLEWR